jgi:hypothetical protein
VKALAVLSSDAISPVAFATEAILINLVAAGSSLKANVLQWLQLSSTFSPSDIIIEMDSRRDYSVARRNPTQGDHGTIA